MNDPRPVALVTGASSGIGLATAHALVDAGFTVVGTSRRGSTGTDAASGGLWPLDVTREESVTALVADVLERHGRLDVLVNNAGIGLLGGAEESTAAQAAAVLDVNVLGVIRMTNAVLPHLRERGSGRIITISSVLGLMPAPYMAVYAASKHAIEGYTESIDHELRRFGVRSLLVEPAYTRSGFEGSAMSPDAPVAAYAAQRGVAADVLAEAMVKADDPRVVAEVVVEAATTARPRVRSTAGRLAGQVGLLRRFAPRRAFDLTVRRINRLD